MKIHELREIVTVQQVARISDGAGGVTETWTPLVALDTPGALTLAQRTSGTLADGQFWFRLVTLDADGRISPAGPQGTITIVAGGGTADIRASWAAVSRAATYRVYGIGNGVVTQYRETTALTLDWCGAVPTACVGLPTADVLGRYDYAAVVPASVRDVERVMAGRVQSACDFLVTIRDRADLTTQCRLTWGTRTLAIRGLARDPGGEILTLACEEVT